VITTSGGDLIAEMLKAEGVDVVFGIIDDRQQRAGRGQRPPRHRGRKR
jgi:hypothetical protein